MAITTTDSQPLKTSAAPPTPQQPPVYLAPSPHASPHSSPHSSPDSIPAEDLVLNPLLCYSQHDIVPGYANQLIWDLREPPTTARALSDVHNSLTSRQLCQPATTPATRVLYITCDIFVKNWPIKIRKARPYIVTVGDVLDAIHDSLYQRISRAEWDSLSEKQQRLIAAVFDSRCKQAGDREATHQNGVLRIDCLMNHTWFGGLTVSLEKDLTCIMSLRRPR